MIEKLFGSQSRAKLLKTFLLNPDKEYYIRQLARDLDLQINSVRRELDNLEKLGLLTSEPRRDADKNGRTEVGQEKKFFKVSNYFPLFEELKSLILKSHILYKQDFVEKLKETGNIELLILSGFFAGTENSETDILVVGKINKEKFVKEVKKFGKEAGRDINFTIMSVRELNYRRSMTDVFLYSVLEGKKVIMINNNLI